MIPVFKGPASNDNMGAAYDKFLGIIIYVHIWRLYKIISFSIVYNIGCELFVPHVQDVQGPATLVPALHILRLLRQRPHTGACQDEKALSR